MKLGAVALALFCAVAYVSADADPSDPSIRVRRQGDLRNRVVVHGNIPTRGKDLRPNLDVNYQHRFVDTGRTTADAYGGANVRSGHVTPQVGVKAEHNFGNGVFATGFGKAHRGPGGRVEPTFGAGVGYRWRRSVDTDDDDEPEEFVGISEDQHLHRFRRQADPRPNVDVNYQHRLVDTGRTTADAFARGNIRSGRVTPHVGVQAERNFRNGVFDRRFGETYRGPRGRVDPIFGTGVGYPFWRREDTQGGHGPIEFSGIHEAHHTNCFGPPNDLLRRDTIHGIIPARGRDLRPIVDLNYQHRFVDTGRTTADTFGGANVRSEGVTPHADA